MKNFMGGGWLRNFWGGVEKFSGGGMRNFFSRGDIFSGGVGNFLGAGLKFFGCGWELFGRPG